MQANTWTLRNAKIKPGKHGTLAPMYKGLKKYRSTNNVEYEFWFCHDDIKRCVSGNKKKYVLDWLVVPNIWHVKIVTNLSRQESLYWLALPNIARRYWVPIAAEEGSLSSP